MAHAEHVAAIAAAGPGGVNAGLAVAAKEAGPHWPNAVKNDLERRGYEMM